MDKLWQLLDKLIEATVVLSFSSIGPRLRRIMFHWKPLQSYNLSDKTIVLTGGTSGIGEQAAKYYAAMGCNLVLIGRNPSKTRATVESLKRDTGNRHVSCVIADLGNLDDVRAAANELLASHTSIDGLIHNAGALFNERTRNTAGRDLTIELMVVSPFLLTQLVLPALKAAGPGRVITMSSGGMYTQGLDVDQLEMSDQNYEGKTQYARAKRAQVVLSELWAERTDPDEIVFQSLHPGWVETPGITEALPRFSVWLGRFGLLRSATEGADTMVWLSVAEEAAARNNNGLFWLDRAVRSTHKISATKRVETPAQREALWTWCQEAIRQCGS